MNTIIGIDVSSKKLNIHILPIGKDFEIDNDAHALTEFVQTQHLSPDSCIVGCESTGRYHMVCQQTFLSLGFSFTVLNPILTNKKISLSVRKKKTDISDAKIIARLLSQGEGVPAKMQDTSRRTILRARQALVKHKVSLKVLCDELKKDPVNKALSSCIHEIEAVITKMKSAITKIETDTLEPSQATPTEALIDSIPGFAAQLSAIVASEVGDFTRFPSARQFKAYVGIDPKVKQSGSSLSTGKITKRGNAHVRYAFYLAAQIAHRWDPELNAFYEKKKREGKHTRVALVAVARKLCERVFAVVRKGIPYEVRTPAPFPFA